MATSLDTNRRPGAAEPPTGLLPITAEASLLSPPPATAVVPPRVGQLLAGLAAAVPGRCRQTFLELLVGAALSRGGHVTDALLAITPTRVWTAYFWFLDYGHWSWLAVQAALLGLLQRFCAPPVWHVILDDSVIERRSLRAPGVRAHFNHAHKPNRPRLIRGQSWVCLAVVLERTVKGVLQAGNRRAILGSSKFRVAYCGVFFFSGFA
jgi:hypothetical protein